MLNTDRIKSLREKLNLTMEEAAQRAGFSSRQQWNNIEKGTAGGEKGITLATLHAIAKALDCKPKDLLK